MKKDSVILLLAITAVLAGLAVHYFAKKTTSPPVTSTSPPVTSTSPGLPPAESAPANNNDVARWIRIGN